MSSPRAHIDLQTRLEEVPLFDDSACLHGSTLSARGLHDLLSDSVMVSALRSAGAPRPRRVGDDREQSKSWVESVVPILSRIHGTIAAWNLRTLLSDLYDWEEPLTTSNWLELDDLIGQRSRDPDWPRTVLQRARIHRLATPLHLRGLGQADDLFTYTLRWAEFARARAGEFDTAVYELERTWGREPEGPCPRESEVRPPTYRVIRSLDDVHAALDHFVGSVLQSRATVLRLEVSNPLASTIPTTAEMTAALARRESAGVHERDVFTAYVLNSLFDALASRGNELAIQIRLGMEAVPSMASWTRRHPHLRFHAQVTDAASNSALCALAPEVPNLNLAGITPPLIHPGCLQSMLAERFDLLPTARFSAFGSEAACVEWAHARAVFVRNEQGRFLEQRIQQGQYDIDQALTLAREVLFESPQARSRGIAD